MYDDLILPTLLAAIVLFYVALWGLRTPAHRLPLPPGPKRKPIIGNLLDWPINSKEWETFSRWQEQFGEQSVSSPRYFDRLTQLPR